MLVQDPVLIDEWHPVMLSSDLTDRPEAVEVLGEKVVVFRTSSGVHAFKDLCIHRGVPLSLGKIVKEELVCAYHGWAYNRCGACTRIPALNPKQAIPSKAKAITYHCVERDGLVWVCLGTPVQEQPKIGRLHAPDCIKVYMGPYHLQAAGPRVIENFLDVSHLMFVHEGLLGDEEHAEIEDYRVHDQDGILRTDEITVYQPDPDGRGRGIIAKYVYEVFHPLSAAFTKRTEGSEEMFRLSLVVLPQNEQKSTAFMIMERNYAPDEPDHTFVQFQDLLLEQDRVIVENQKPELLPLDLQAELHLKCDRLSLSYRKMLNHIGMTFGTA